MSFSWKRALGMTKLKREFTKATGIPTTKVGVERKLCGVIIKAIFGKKWNEANQESGVLYGMQKA